MSKKIENPVVLIYKRENSDPYAVAITSGSQDYRDAVQMAAMEPDMTGDNVDTWSKTGYDLTRDNYGFYCREVVKRMFETWCHCRGLNVE
ncbi:TPA: hypothetical protein ACWC4P_001249 [Salmonella enterica]